MQTYATSRVLNVIICIASYEIMQKNITTGDYVSCDVILTKLIN